MPLNLRAQNKYRNFNVGVSYKKGMTDGKLLDARNVNSVQNRLDTRFGTSRRNAVALPGPIQSISSFVKSDGTVYEIAKVGAKMFLLAESGPHTELISGMNETAKHRGITVNDRHVMTIGDDGLYGMYSFDGTVFSVLGQPVPQVVPTVAAAAGGALAASTYKVAYTFYASSIGFESNFTESAEVVVALNEKINVSGLQGSATNNFIDRVFVYLKDVTNDGEYLYIEENGLEGLPVGTTSISISAQPLSSQTPPVNNAPPQQGGGKFLTQFGSETVYAGRTGFLNEVYFSEPNLPDAYSPNGDQKVLVIPGDGAITGIKTGLFSDAHLSPYLVIFKKKSIHIYSDLNGDGGNLVCINDKVGCVSHDTIILKDGNIFFLSEEGWRGIINGRLLSNKQGESVTLGDGDIDDIFRSPGYIYEVNRDNVDDAFSVFYPALNQYMTWVAEGANEAFSKTYVYEFDVGGFKPWEFSAPGTCACLSKDSSGRDIVLIGGSDGFVLKHSIYESRNDVDLDNAPKAIAASVVFPWAPEDSDFDATYNYRELIVKSVNAGEVGVKTFLNYGLNNVQSSTMEFATDDDGFILDESLLDEGILGDERRIRPAHFDINRVGESIAFGFYQSIANGNLGLVGIQLDLSKNGNRNIPGQDESDEVFGSEEDQFQFTFTPSQLQELINALSTRVTSLESMMGLGNQNVDGSWRCRLIGGQFVIQVRESGSWVDRYAIDPTVG